jgi:hypothetical protein
MNTNDQRDPHHANQPRLFDNLITMEELLCMLKHQYAKTTVYKWVQRENTPHKRIRGKLWFPRDKVTL